MLRQPSLASNTDGRAVHLALSHFGLRLGKVCALRSKHRDRGPRLPLSLVVGGAELFFAS